MHYLLFSAGHLYPTVELMTPIEELSWVKGRPLDETIPRLRFEMDAGSTFEWPDFIRPAANIPLVSPQMRQALEAAGVDNVEYYPADVVNRATNEARPYFGANIIGLVSAMDRDQSDFMPYEDDPVLAFSVDRLVLDEAKCDDVALFRLAEFDLLVVIDEGVKAELERRNLVGLEITPPEEWDGFST